jgi:hypothetical protein
MPSAPSPLEDLLARRTREGELYEKLPKAACAASPAATAASSRPGATACAACASTKAAS